MIVAAEGIWNFYGHGTLSLASTFRTMNTTAIFLHVCHTQIVTK